MNLENLIVVRPDWLVPIEQPPIHFGFLALCDNKIEYLGATLPSRFEHAPQVRLTDYAILPGLINSHCHLEFSDLATPIPVGDCFPDWILAVIRHRSGGTLDPGERLSLKRQAYENGLQESYACGVRWIVDMTTSPWSPEWIESTVQAVSPRNNNANERHYGPSIPISVQSCMELVDVNPVRWQQTCAFAETQFAANEIDSNVLSSMGRFGLAPHSPYTASLELTKWSQQRSAQQQRLVAMHLAESVDEIRWLAERNGSFKNLMEPFLCPDYWSGLSRIGPRVECLTGAWKSLVVHGNFLTESELVMLASTPKTMGLVHCPRTHLHFRHQHAGSDGYPMSERLKLGVRHFLGTDSRASNPNLNLWQEAQQLRASHPDLLSLDILKMITTDAADFLEVPWGVGRIQLGSEAGLTAVKVSETPGISVYDDLLAAKTTALPLEMALLREPGPSGASGNAKLR